MAMIVADTDVLLDYLTSRQPATSAIKAMLEEGTLCTTAVNQVELLTGARTAHAQSAIARLLAETRVLALDQDAADRAANVARGLAARGEPIGLGDCLIAGIALHHGGAIFTRNRKHFE